LGRRIRRARRIRTAHPPSAIRSIRTPCRRLAGTPRPRCPFEHRVCRSPANKPTIQTLSRTDELARSVPGFAGAAGVLRPCQEIPGPHQGISSTFRRRVSMVGLKTLDVCNTLLPPEVVRSSNQKEGTLIEPPRSPRAHRWQLPTTGMDAYVQRSVPAEGAVKLARSTRTPNECGPSLDFANSGLQRSAHTERWNSRPVRRQGVLDDERPMEGLGATSAPIHPN
jgi:hypothetical protein